MKTYTIKYTMENWYEIKVTAENKEQAREIFFADDNPRLFGRARLFGGELQEDIDIEEEASA